MANKTDKNDNYGKIQINLCTTDIKFFFPIMNNGVSILLNFHSYTYECRCKQMDMVICPAHNKLPPNNLEAVNYVTKKE